MRPFSVSRHIGSLVCVASVSSFFIGSNFVFAQSKPEPFILEILVDPILDLGLGTANLLRVASTPPSLPDDVPPTAYSKLALDIQRRVDEGRAVSGVVGANAALIEKSLTYVALTDPEPMSKVVAGVAAYGARKGGQLLIQKVIEDSEGNARKILARGLKETYGGVDSFKGMQTEEIKKKILDMRVGGEQITKILTDPGSLELLQNHMIDMANDTGLEAIRRTTVVEQSVDEMRTEIRQGLRHIEVVRRAVGERATKIEGNLGDLSKAVLQNSHKLEALQEMVATNTRAIGSLAEISFSGWSTDQKLQAVRSGLYPNLSPEIKAAVTESLEAQFRQEKIVGEISDVAGNLGSIANISQGLGLPKDITEAASTGAALATGAAQFLSGNYLGAISSLVSLGGMGSPDPAAERHKQMMEYLSKQFAQINATLKRVEDLQIKTIEEIRELQDQQQKFRIEVLTQLNRMEALELDSNRILQALLLQQWQDCDAMAGNSSMPWGPTIKDSEHLLRVLGASETRGYITRCYAEMAKFLDAQLMTLNWSAGILDASVIGSPSIPADGKLLTEVRAKQTLENNAYRSAAAMLRVALAKELTDQSARVSARLAQPVSTASSQKELRELLAADDTLASSSFSCSHGTLSVSLAEVLCFNRTGDVPSTSRLGQIMDSPMLGPGVDRLLSHGVLLATFADLAYDESDGRISLVQIADIQNISTQGLSRGLQQAAIDRPGLRALKRLQNLVEILIIQRSAAYGDLTAEVAERLLYDPQTHALTKDPATRGPGAIEAWRALKDNPVLARNVVHLALRHAISDIAGGEEAADQSGFLLTRYSFGYGNFRKGDVCQPSEASLMEWQALFPAWNISYAALPDEKKDAVFEKCTPAVTGSLDTVPRQAGGWGVVTKLSDDLSVELPSPMDLASGALEQPASLLKALAMRERLSQLVLDRTLRRTVEDAADTTNDPDLSRSNLTYRLLRVSALDSSRGN